MTERQSVLAVLISLASMTMTLCLLITLVVLFEFIVTPEERLWPVRIARTAVAANIVSIIAFIAYVHS